MTERELSRNGASPERGAAHVNGVPTGTKPPAWRYHRADYVQQQLGLGLITLPALGGHRRDCGDISPLDC
jgi:hypothetical protein